MADAEDHNQELASQQPQLTDQQLTRLLEDLEESLKQGVPSRQCRSLHATSIYTRAQPHSKPHPASCRSLPPGLLSPRGSTYDDDSVPPARRAAAFDLEDPITRLELLFKLLVQGRLKPEQALYVMTNALPKFIMMLFRAGTGMEVAERMAGFLQLVLECTARMLRTTDAWEIVESATRVLTDGAYYAFYTHSLERQGSPSHDLDSVSSGDASCSDASAEEDTGERGDSILSAGAARDDASP